MGDYNVVLRRIVRGIIHAGTETFTDTVNSDPLCWSLYYAV